MIKRQNIKRSIVPNAHAKPLTLRHIAIPLRNLEQTEDRPCQRTIGLMWCATGEISNIGARAEPKPGLLASALLARAGQAISLGANAGHQLVP